MIEDDDLKRLEEWLQSDEGKKAIQESQHGPDGCKVCKLIDGMNKIDPWIYKEPFDI